jgi:predicted metallopeptidase
MKYEYAPDLQKIAEDVCVILFPHVKLDRIKCFRSYGTSSRGTIARCHALGKLMQKALGVEAFYPLEFLSERFDKLSEEEQLKVIIHELMHIPKTFGGGFRQHDWVKEENVEAFYKEYKIKKRERIGEDTFDLDIYRRRNEENLNRVSIFRKKWFS